MEAMIASGCALKDLPECGHLYPELELVVDREPNIEREEMERYVY